MKKSYNKLAILESISILKPHFKSTHNHLKKIWKVNWNEKWLCTAKSENIIDICQQIYSISKKLSSWKILKPINTYTHWKTGAIYQHHSDH